MARPRIYGQDVRTKIRELYRFYPIKAVAELTHVSHMTVSVNWDLSQWSGE